MPIYDYRCACGEEFESFVISWHSASPQCPACGAVPTRRPSRIAILGHSKDARPLRPPTSWQSARNGDPEFVTHWRRTVERRNVLADKYPELGEQRTAVAAHEGRFHARPLSVSDLPPSDTAERG